MEVPPLVLDIRKATVENPYYRRVIHTTKDSQIVLMSLRPGEDIPKEVHTGDQFVRVEAGQGEAAIDDVFYAIKDDIAVNIPAGHWHYFKATGLDPLKMYLIYSPPEHSPTRIEYTDPVTGEKVIVQE